MFTVEHNTLPEQPVAARRDIATACLSGTLEDKLAAAAAAGFQGVEIFENDLVVSLWSPQRIRRHCADLALKETLGTHDVPPAPRLVHALRTLGDSCTGFERC